MLGSPGRTEFVGRARELAILTGAFEAARAGRGGGVLIAGEPGIGKTRLAEELARIATAAGGRSVWGRCYEGDGAPAFWPWVQVIRAHARTLDLDTLRAHLGLEAPDIAAIVPQLRECLPELARTSGDEEHARFRVFEAVTIFFQRAAAEQPLILVLDDLHWADTPSLLLLQFLAGGLPGSRVLVVGAYRDVEVTRQHPLASTLAALTREGAGRIALRGLDEEDIARFVGQLTGEQPSASWLSRIQRETDGNPFFVGEVLHLLTAEGRLDAGGEGGLPIPDRVREVILQRVERLPAACQQLLTSAAVVGRDFRVSTLAHVSGLQALQALAVLEAAETARVVSAVPSDPGRYRFAHALIRETLYEELTNAARIGLHRQVGEALEVEYAGNRDPYLAELAFHGLQASPAGESEKAVDYATRAADRAMGLLAYEEAARYFEISLRALDLVTPRDEARRCYLLLCLGEARERAGDRQPASEAFREAAGSARDIADPERFARAALGYGGPPAATTVADPTAIGLLEEALRLLPTSDGLLRARVIAQLVDVLYFTHDWDRVDALSREAVAIARRIGDPITLGVALSARHQALWRPDTGDERLIVATELLQVAEQAGDLDHRMHGHNWRIVDLAELGRIDEVDREIDRLSRLADASRQPYYVWVAALRRGTRKLMAGRFDEAERLIEHALAIGHRVHSEAVERYHMSQMLFLRWDQGRLAELEPVQREYVASLPQFATYRAILALVLCEQGRMEGARGLFEEIAADDFATVDRYFAWYGVMYFLAEVCAALGDGPRAAILFRMLRPYGDRIMLAGRFAACFGSTHYPLGLLATTMGALERAEAHFEHAIKINTRIGARPWVARSRYHYARMLWRRDGQASREAIVELITPALDACREMEMIRLAGQLEALQQAIDGASVLADGAGQPALADGVTRREGDVLRLLADGRTTKEIAAELSISPATVERHITNLYGKIGARGRADATAYALRHGLITFDPP